MTTINSGGGHTRYPGSFQNVNLVYRTDPGASTF